MEITPSSIISRRRWRVADADAHFAGEGQEEEIGDAHAVDGGHEGHGDAAAHFLHVVEMLHHLDEAEHRAENADGGREAAGRLEDRGQPFFVFGDGVEADAHDLAQFGGLGAVDGQHEGLLEKRILDGLQIGVERDDAVAAGLVGEGDQQVDELVVAACGARKRRGARLLNAASTVGSGNCSSTAPMVPPKTIRAAVGCRIWPRLPPSMSRPATMPAMARMTPPMLALSMNCSSRV